MRGIVFTGNRKLDLRQFPDPVPGPDQAVVIMRASGICGSDLHPFRGLSATSHISGHEPCGVVSALGHHAIGSNVGDRVIVYHYSGDGTCKYCRTGWEQLCPNGRKTYGFGENGGNADYILVPARTLVPLPDELSFEEGAAIACGTGTAYGAMLRLQASGRDTLAVFGAGPVGLSVVLLAKAMGARVISIDISPARLDFARGLGADYTIDSREVEPPRAIADLTHGEGADLAVDCTGNAEARAQMVRCVRIFGTACFVGEGGTVTLNVSPDVIKKRLTIMGSWTFSLPMLGECSRFIVDRKVPLHKLITGRYTLDQAEQALADFEGGSVGKSVFVMPE
jgi:threonine dehydrogenase-like Zn-dependent dehydrogenase